MEPTVFTQLFIVAMLLCIQTGILFINPFSQTIFISVAIVTQVFLYCVCGEMIAIKAYEVSLKLYESHWYDLRDEEMKKMLVMVLCRSQQPCYFSVGDYLPLSMETFGRVSCFKGFWY